uniref:Glycosyltransferase n=1 Tax=Cajanus cajan TaxID=3821 RepID=A0A151QYK8_CAJCA|nr:Hydroquinone glucosyltransferase [Cajanus cajan]
MERRTHIAVVSVPVVSHQIAISEFCKRLIQLNPIIRITFIIPVLDSLPNASKSILCLSFSPKHTHHCSSSSELASRNCSSTQTSTCKSQSLPLLHDALFKSITSTSHVAAIVADYFAYELLPFAKELNILSYIFFPSAATVTSLCLHSSTLHETISCEYKELQEPINIPGCIPIHGRDLPTSFQDRSSEVYKHFLLRSKALRVVDGILVNSFVELEEGALRAMTEESKGNPSVYMVGPIVQNVSHITHNNYNGSHCLAWLDEQTHRSVLFVTFGSGATLSQHQMNELALGLEQSSQKFVWVVREPNDLPSANYFGGSSRQEDPLSFLPCGFLERTKNQGLVIPFWAPQVEILSHKAISGFLSHCGWFSTLEAVVNGLPTIVWPLFAEQRMIATILVDGLKVAVRPKASESGIVERCEVAKAIKSLMVGDEGMEIRNRMKVLQDAAASAMKIDGFSTTTLSQLVTKWESFGACKENVS